MSARKANVRIPSFKDGTVDFNMVFDHPNATYYSSANKIINLIVHPGGSLVRRPGTKLVTHAYDGQLIKLFSFNHDNNTIVIECYLGKIIFLIGSHSIVKRNNMFTISTQWVTEQQVRDINLVFDHIKNQIYAFSPSQPPKVITFDSSYQDFLMKDMEFQDGPYDPIQKDVATLTFQATNENDIFINSNKDIFSMNDTRRLIRIYQNGSWGSAEITNYSSQKKVLAIVKKPFSLDTSTSVYRFGAWSAKLGYPKYATIFNGRLYCASTETYNNRLWVSKLWEYDNFAPTSKAGDESIEVIGYDDSLDMTIADVSNVFWISSNKESVILGSKEGVFTVSSLKSDEPISPYNYGVLKISDSKSSSIVFSSDFATFYADYHQRQLYAIEISQDKILYMRHINLHASGLFDSNIKDMIFVDYPFHMLWVLLENGNLLCATLIYMTGEVKYAWSKHILGGVEAQIKAIGQSVSKGVQHLWVHVSRRINDTYKYSLEQIVLDHHLLTQNSDEIIYMDCNFKVNIKDHTIFDLNNHLGDQLAFLGVEGIYLGEHVIAEDHIIFAVNDYTDQQVNCGYNYQSLYQSHPLEIVGGNISQRKRLTNIAILFSNSYGFSIYDDQLAFNIHDLDYSIQDVKEVAHMRKYSFKVDSNLRDFISIIVEQLQPFNLNIVTFDLQLDFY